MPWLSGAVLGKVRLKVTVAVVGCAAKAFDVLIDALIALVVVEVLGL